MNFVPFFKSNNKKVLYQIVDKDHAYYNQQCSIYTTHRDYSFVLLNQVHGIDIVDMDFNDHTVNDHTVKHKADAMITSKSNCVLVIQTSDCVPVLISDTKCDVIGAAHCGWRSVKAGIIPLLVKSMKKKGADELSAIIGPSIQQFSYEVDSAFYQNFIDDYDESRSFFINSSKNVGHYLFDLQGFAEYQLQSSGVNIAHKIKEDTYSNHLKYPSYRRFCHQKDLHRDSNRDVHGEQNKESNREPNILSMIMLK